MFPSIELPTVSVRTGYEGASPDVVEAQVTQILEEIVATVPGVEEITSVSSEGRSRLRVRFVWGTDIDAAALEVQAKLEDELNELPDEIVRPWVGKFDIESFPVVILGISSNMDPVQMTELVNRQIRYRFARIPGVAQVDLFGGFNREVRVELDRTRLEALGLPLNQILQALRDANLDRPSGRIEEGRFEVTLRAPAQFQTINQIRDTVIATRDGNMIRLGQVAEVLATYERITEIDRINGERGIRVGIRKQANANTVEVSRAILQEIEAVNIDYPQIEIVAVSNSGNFIERSIASTQMPMGRKSTTPLKRPVSFAEASTKRPSCAGSSGPAPPIHGWLPGFSNATPHPSYRCKGCTIRTASTASWDNGRTRSTASPPSSSVLRILATCPSWSGSGSGM